jgi:hypothetical protein
MFRTVRRKIPWMLAFEAAMAARRHWNALPADDRRRLGELARRSGGRWGRLTPEERTEFRGIARRLNYTGFARDMMPFGRRLRRPGHH